MHNTKLSNIILEEHKKCISDPTKSVDDDKDIKLIFEDGELWYKKLLLVLIYPDLKTILKEDQDISVIIFPSISVETLTNLYSDFEYNSAVPVDIESIPIEFINEGPQISSTTDVKVYCELCGLEYKSIKQLKAHKWKQHKSRDELFQCNECDKLFLHQFELNKHAVTHEAPSFVCHFCEKRFKRKKALLQHYDVFHADNAPVFKCSKCPLSFNVKSNLTRHFKTHTRENYICKFCDAIFTRCDSYKRHLLKMHS